MGRKVIKIMDKLADIMFNIDAAYCEAGHDVEDEEINEVLEDIRATLKSAYDDASELQSMLEDYISENDDKVQEKEN